MGFAAVAFTVGLGEEPAGHIQLAVVAMQQVLHVHHGRRRLPSCFSRPNDRLQSQHQTPYQLPWCSLVHHQIRTFHRSEQAAVREQGVSGEGLLLELLYGLGCCHHERRIHRRLSHGILSLIFHLEKGNWMVKTLFFTQLIGHLPPLGMLIFSILLLL